MTSLETKTQILHDLYVSTSVDDDLYDFVNLHDLGIPLSVLVVQNCATATPAGVEWILSDYNDLCDELGIDKYGDYESLDDLLEMSEYEQG